MLILRDAHAFYCMAYSHIRLCSLSLSLLVVFFSFCILNGFSFLSSFSSSSFHFVGLVLYRTFVRRFCCCVVERCWVELLSSCFVLRFAFWLSFRFRFHLFVVAIDFSYFIPRGRLPLPRAFCSHLIVIAIVTPNSPAPPPLTSPPRRSLCCSRLPSLLSFCPCCASSSSS